ncbi:MAG: bactofilin family protein [Rhizomicrobium sp.]
MPDTHATQSPLSSEARRPQAVAMPASQASTSVISKALKITGQLESSEHIQVDGQIEGDVKGLSVKVGPGAKVRGTVSGDEVELSGAIEGKIEAKKVILTGTARMSGDVIHQDIRIESGAYIDGHLRPESAVTKTPQLKPVSLDKTA